VIPVELELHGELHQAHRPWIARVHAMAEPGRTVASAEALVHDLVRGPLQRVALLDEVEAAIEEAHGRLDVPSVVGAEAEDPRGHRVPERRARGGDVPRDDGGGRCGPVIHRGDENRADHLPDGRGGQFARQQQVDGLGEAEPPHQLVDVVPADHDAVLLDARERRLPGRGRRARRRPALDRVRTALLGHGYVVP
jgi:hypothetical protein